jgi:hypothetical protein
LSVSPFSTKRFTAINHTCSTQTGQFQLASSNIQSCSASFLKTVSFCIA